MSIGFMTMFTVSLGIHEPSFTDDMEPVMGATSQHIDCASLDDAMTIVAAHQTAVDVYYTDVYDTNNTIVHSWRR